MALTRTTLSSAVAAGDKSIVIASITALAVGQPITIDSEELRVTSVPTDATLPVGVLRGVNGTAAAAHAVSAGVRFGPPADFPAGSSPRVREISSYSAAGAIALPNPGNDAVAVLNGTVALAMTLAVPGKENDGDILTIIGNGKAAHTVTATGGLGAAGSGYTVGTFDTGGQCAVQLMAANSVWVPLPSPFSGTLTAIDVAVA